VSRPGGGARILIVPDDGGESRSLHLKRSSLRLLAGGAFVLLLLFAGVTGSWWYLAARAARVPELQARVAMLEGQQVRIEALAGQLRAVEERYSHIRALFGSDSAGPSARLRLPPVNEVRPSEGGAEGGERVPTSWPLTERGFVTQPLLRGGGEEHEGVDIAVPTGSYIRAAGAGTVAEVGADPVYGRFVVLDHGGGYRSLYAHASETFVERGQWVRRDEVLGLTGSTGRSTAPHLHFEIHRDDEPVDPLTLVTRPS